MKLSAARDDGPRWQYRLWEFDPTWPDAENGPEVTRWEDRSVAEIMFTNATNDPERPATRRIKVQRRAVRFGEPEAELLDAVPDWRGEDPPRPMTTTRDVVELGPPRGHLSPEVEKAARRIHRAVWGDFYEPGKGPMHYAGGPYWRNRLLQLAASWERMAAAARVCAEALPRHEGGE